jgi:NADPH2:quinone reductase
VFSRAGGADEVLRGKVPPFDRERLAAGAFFVTRPILKHDTATRAELVQRSTDVFEAIVAGSLDLRIEHTYPLDQARQAHQDLEGRQTTGKLVLLSAPDAAGRRASESDEPDGLDL